MGHYQEYSPILMLIICLWYICIHMPLSWVLFSGVSWFFHVFFLMFDQRCSTKTSKTMFFYDVFQFHCPLWMFKTSYVFWVSFGQKTRPVVVRRKPVSAVCCRLKRSISLWRKMPSGTGFSPVAPWKSVEFPTNSLTIKLLCLTII